MLARAHEEGLGDAIKQVRSPTVASRAAVGDYENDLDAAVEKAIASVDLAAAADRPMGTYSRGMRQRMRLAGTLVHDPEILILDEPLNGADPRQRVHFQSLLRELAAEGRIAGRAPLHLEMLQKVHWLAVTIHMPRNSRLRIQSLPRRVSSTSKHWRT